MPDFSNLLARQLNGTIRFSLDKVSMGKERKHKGLRDGFLVYLSR